MSRVLVLIGLCIVFGAQEARARIFDFADKRASTYFRGSYGPSNVGDSAFGQSSGAGVDTDQTVSSHLSGEIGFVFAATKLNLRIGVEYLMPKKLSDVSGSNGSGAKMFDLESEITALIPGASIELIMYQSPVSRILLGVGLGLASVALENVYTMTPAGNAALGVGDFTEKGKANVATAQAYIGWERHFTDTVTVLFEAGYRHLPVAELESSSAAATISDSSLSDGEALKNMNGGTRTLDLSGPFAGLAFRFYIGL